MRPVITTTAIGGTYTFGNPLTNNQGITQASSNANSNIVGLVTDDSAAVYGVGGGGSPLVGGPGNVLGAWMPPAPLGAPAAMSLSTVPLASEQKFEYICLELGRNNGRRRHSRGRG